MSDNPHESPHERIFLQYWMDETTWCKDRIDGCVTGDYLSDEIDTEYIRLDVHESELARLREVERAARVLVRETNESCNRLTCVYDDTVQERADLCAALAKGAE